MYVYNCAASCGNGTPPPPVPVDEVEPHFLYFVNHSQQPPQIHKLLICHSKNLLCRPNISLVLSGIFQAAMNQGINLGFAECVTDLKDILDFLEEYYGPLSTWDQQAAKENGLSSVESALQLTHPTETVTGEPVPTSSQPAQYTPSLSKR